MINSMKLEKRYRQLLYVSYKKYPDVEPDFESGLWKEQEYYKYKVWEDARAKLKLETWEKEKGNHRYIYDCAVAAINASDNLLAKDYSSESKEAYRSTYNLVVAALLENLDVTAEALYGIFGTESTINDGHYFDDLAKIVSKVLDGFSFIAYFFFLKNKDLYAPVRRKGDRERLAKLDLGGRKIMETCSWKNYMEFMTVVKEIHLFLLDKGYEATLLDAQSFLWMLWMVNNETPELEENSDPFETTVTKSSVFFKEGKQIEFYGTKAERDPRLRRAFLKTQPRPYRCEVCGMDFESVYGEIGIDVIDVHHKKPLSIDGKEILVEPTSEYLACLCSNCHRIIHKRKNSVFTVEELRQMMAGRK